MTDSPYVVFHRGGRRFAVPLDKVRRIAHRSLVTSLPRPAPGVLGLVETRGILFTLVETPLPPPAENRHSRILLIQGRSALGFFVDGVEGVRNVESFRAYQGHPPRPELSALNTLPPPESRHVLGPQLIVGGSLAWTLDLDALFKDSEEVAA